MVVRIKHYTYLQKILRSLFIGQKPKEITIIIEGLESGKFKDLIKVKGINMESLSIES